VSVVIRKCCDWNTNWPRNRKCTVSADKSSNDKNGEKPQMAKAKNGRVSVKENSINKLSAITDYIKVDIASLLR